MEYSNLVYNGNSRYPHGPGTQNYGNQVVFRGTWDRGLKVGSGSYTVSGMVLNVKIKSGKIHKLLSIQSASLSKNLDKLLRFKLRQPDYSKQGDYFIENPNSPFIFLHCSNDQPLFDGKPLEHEFIDKIFQNNERSRIGLVYSQYKDLKNLDGLIDKVDNFQVTSIAPRLIHLDIVCCKYIGRAISLSIFVGRAIFILLDGIYLKGIIRGTTLHGIWTAKKGELKWYFELIKNKVNLLKVESKAFNYEMKFEKDEYGVKMNVIKESEFIGNHEINRLSLECIQSIHEFVDRLLSIISYRESVISRSLNVKNWRSYEASCLEKNESSRTQYMRSFNRLSDIENKRKFYLQKGEVYEGDIYDEKLSGVGKYIYENGFVYLGEFKNGKKDGIGCLRFLDGSLFKGYFKNDVINGRGMFISSAFKVIGLWKDGNLEKVYKYLTFENKN